MDHVLFLLVRRNHFVNAEEKALFDQDVTRKRSIILEKVAYDLN